MRLERQRKKDHREARAEIAALAKTVGSLFATQSKTLDHVEVMAFHICCSTQLLPLCYQGIAAESSVGQRGVSGNPQERSGLPWKTNRDMVQ